MQKDCFVIWNSVTEEGPVKLITVSNYIQTDKLVISIGFRSYNDNQISVTISVINFNNIIQKLEFDEESFIEDLVEIKNFGFFQS